MKYLFHDDGRSGTSWVDYFDVIVGSSDKPRFYTSGRPFRVYDLENDSLTWTKAEALSTGRFYVHGNLKEFLQQTSWRGQEVVYFGDHLANDLRGPTRAGWHTVAVIREVK